MTVLFSELRSPQIADAAKEQAVLILPFGQIEEHGPHLPIHTDSFIAERLAEAVARELAGSPPCYVMEPLAYGYSQKVLQRWPGTFVIPQEVVIQVLYHTLLSAARMGFRKVVVLSTHGNHVGVSRVAARKVADECGMGPAAYYPFSACSELIRTQSQCGPNGSCHAGEFETSLMLHLAPQLVDMDAATDVDAIRVAKPCSSGDAFLSTWTLQESQTGVYGDPTKAAAQFGKQLFDTMLAATVDFVRDYHGLKQV